MKYTPVAHAHVSNISDTWQEPQVFTEHQPESWQTFAQLFTTGPTPLNFDVKPSEYLSLLTKAPTATVTITVTVIFTVTITLTLTRTVTVTLRLGQ